MFKIGIAGQRIVDQFELNFSQIENSIVNTDESDFSITCIDGFEFEFDTKNYRIDSSQWGMIFDKSKNRLAMGKKLHDVFLPICALYKVRVNNFQPKLIPTKRDKRSTEELLEVFQVLKKDVFTEEQYRDRVSELEKITFCRFFDVVLGNEKKTVLGENIPDSESVLYVTQMAEAWDVFYRERGTQVLVAKFYNSENLFDYLLNQQVQIIR